MTERFAPPPKAGVPVLQLQGVNVFYGRSHAVQGVDLTLHAGVLSVVGRNGMGKTTMCKAIMGLVPIASGSIRNHLPETMVKAFEMTGLSRADVEQRFGGLYRAFQYGAPPHGGMAAEIGRAHV